MVLPLFADWKAPWESEEKDDEGKPVVKFDLEKAKKYQYGLLTDKEKIQGDVTRLTEEKTTLQTQVDAVTRKDETELDKLKRENAVLIAKGSEPAKDSVETLKLRVALKEGLTETQAKRLVGNTIEELTADATDLLASFGGNGSSDDDDDDDKASPATRPRRNLRNGGDPNPDGDKDFDPDAILDKAYSGNLF